jgi:hypothetical protein
MVVVKRIVLFKMSSDQNTHRASCSVWPGVSRGQSTRNPFIMYFLLPGGSGGRLMLRSASLSLATIGKPGDSSNRQIMLKKDSLINQTQR